MSGGAAVGSRRPPPCLTQCLKGAMSGSIDAGAKLATPFMRFEISLRATSAHCLVRTPDRAIALGAVASEDDLVFHVVSENDLTQPGTVVVDGGEFVSVRVVPSLTGPAWASPAARPLEDEDVVEESARMIVRLADGFSPRELVAGVPVRWLGSAASIEVDPEAGVQRVRLRGRIGPSLGRGASLRAFANGMLATSVPLDFEDGEILDTELVLSDVARVSQIELVIDRPYPRFVQQDHRILNLLVDTVGVA